MLSHVYQALAVICFAVAALAFMPTPTYAAGGCTGACGARDDAGLCAKSTCSCTCPAPGNSTVKTCPCQS